MPTHVVTATTPGARYYFNPIRKGSEATDERVIDLMSGEALKFDVVSGAQARRAGHPAADVDTSYICIQLPRPVPKDGEVRLRIWKTYKDPRTYYRQGDTIVFDRSLGIRRNAVVLPKGYQPPEVTSTSSDLAARIATLTPQQVRVLQMLRQGLLNKQIAYELDVSEATIKAHMTAVLRKLGAKSYQDSFSPTPEFVVLFLPSESFHGAALEQVPDLIQEGVDNKVLIATPTSLIGLLKVVAYGWRQERMAESAEQVAALGRQLHKRIATMAGHLAKLGRAIGTTTNAYNDTIGSLERQVLVSARKLSDHGVESGKEIETPSQVDTAVRRLQAPELVDGDDGDDIRVTQLPKLAS